MLVWLIFMVGGRQYANGDNGDWERLDDHDADDHDADDDDDDEWEDEPVDQQDNDNYDDDEDNDDDDDDDEDVDMADDRETTEDGRRRGVRVHCVRVQRLRIFVPLVSDVRSNAYDDQPELLDADALRHIQHRLHELVAEATFATRAVADGGQSNTRTTRTRTPPTTPPFTVTAVQAPEHGEQAAAQLAEWIPRLEREVGVQLVTTTMTSRIPLALVWDIMLCLGLVRQGQGQEHDLDQDQDQEQGQEPKSKSNPSATTPATSYVFQCRLRDLFCEEEEDEEEDEEDGDVFQISFSLSGSATTTNDDVDVEPTVQWLQIALFFPYSLDPVSSLECVLEAAAYCKSRLLDAGFPVEERYVGICDDLLSKTARRTKNKRQLLQASVKNMVDLVHGWGLRFGDEPLQNLY